MLALILIAATIFLFIVAPCWTILRYYKPEKFSLGVNILLILLTALTWPLVPVVVATKRRDALLLSMFWVSLLVWLVSLAYWLTLNVEQFIQFQEQYRM